MKIITTLVNVVLRMSAVPWLVMTVVVRMTIRKIPWSLLVCRAHAYTTNNCLFISAISWVFPTSYCQCNIFVSAESVAAFEDIGDSESDVDSNLTST